MLMPETGNGGATGAIENPAAILGNEPHAVAADGLGRCFAQASMQHAAVAGAHECQPFSAKYCALQSSLSGEDLACCLAMQHMLQKKRFLSNI
jgi:hypothetical protein